MGIEWAGGFLDYAICVRVGCDMGWCFQYLGKYMPLVSHYAPVRTIFMSVYDSLSLLNQ